MKVLFVHNAYQHKGGEDGVVEAEIRLLRLKGHEVETYFKHNDAIKDQGKLNAVRNIFWSSTTTSEIKAILHRFKPDVIHAHNTFPLISPSLYWVADKENVPIVQTLHNFRLMCLSGFYLRDGKVCEDCTNKTPLKGVVKKCYRGSYLESAALAGMLTLHRNIGSYQNKVTRFIALNDFCKQKFIVGGIDGAKISIKPNFIDLPRPQKKHRKNFIFVGRLSSEKGISTLATVAKNNPHFSISVAGVGEEAGKLSGIPNIKLLGSLTPNKIQDMMSSAFALILPSIWYENFPLTLIEAFASELPVIASKIGALAELVDDNKTGLLFEPNNPKALEDKMNWAMNNSLKMEAMGENARLEYERKYTPNHNHDRLISIYKEAITDKLKVGRQ